MRRGGGFRPGLGALFVAASALVLVLVLVPSPAAADPPRPSDYRSEVTEVSPATEVIAVSIVGGDSLVELRVDAGHEVTVLGYQDEPYLKFRDDGQVEANLNSPATYANTTRYAEDDPPADTAGSDQPVWRRVGTAGSYAWHDHRVHLMSTEPPAGARPGEMVKRWDLRLVVDGQPVTVNGVLTLEPAVAVWPWLAVTTLAAVAMWLAARRWPGSRAVALAVACGAGVLVAWVEQLSIPADAGREPWRVAVPVGGLGCAVAALLWQRRLGTTPAIVATAAAAGWAVARFAVLTKPVLPTDLPANIDRAATAVVLGVALGAAAGTLRRSRRPSPSSRRVNETVGL